LHSTKVVQSYGELKAVTESKTIYRTLLETKLRAKRNSNDSSSMKAYMKGEFDFIGVKSNARKLALRECISELGVPKDSEFNAVIKEMWMSPYREVHYCAQELVERKKWWRQEESIILIEHLIRNNQWWDSIDFIAATLVGSYFKCHGVDKTRIRSWNQENDIWVVRTSILFQLKYKNEVDLPFLSELILPHLESQEFFIQKAIGWILRQVSKSNPDFVRGFMSEHLLKPTSHREAIKYI